MGSHCDRRFALDKHVTGARIEQPIDQLHGRGLPRTAAAEQHQRLARLDAEIEIGEQRPAARSAHS
jgi:hypothetical protein